GTSGAAVWRPRFSYYGFRYVHFRGAVPREQLNLQSLPEIIRPTGMHTRNAAPEVGMSSCSDTIYNRIHTMIDWAIRSNIASMLADCPHRERLGWLEQGHLMGPSTQ